MAAELSAPPVLSASDDHILDAFASASASHETSSTLSDDALRSTYEIARTAAEIRAGGWKQIALQFPDHMLVDAPRVSELLGRELETNEEAGEHTGQDVGRKARRICILADTSYSACCVDEIAAEHADADGVVHYGRTCLSPTSRVPVIYIYTRHELDHDVVLDEFEGAFGDREARVVVMADLTYQDHVESVVKRLREDRGYRNVVATEVVRDPAGLIPNRQIQGSSTMDEECLKSHALFHISDPPVSLLLALHSRFSSLHVLSTPSPSPTTQGTNKTPTLILEDSTLRTAGLLRRRFARVLSLAAAGVVGILVNTLSVSNYLSSMELLRDQIARAGKKSYTVVVGKLNPAKLANFAEIEGWVVVGCWESGLVEDDAEYWRPVVTPFEMEVALMSERERTWGGEWWGGIEKLSLKDGVKLSLKDGVRHSQGDGTGEEASGDVDEDHENGQAVYADGGVEGDESLPPEFDLRTGKLVSHSRPMRLTVRSAAAARLPGSSKAGDGGSTPNTLIKRTTAGELASVNGVVSPGAEFLRSQRTWQGLGSDVVGSEESALVEEGRRGVARGYVVGDEETRR